MCDSYDSNDPWKLPPIVGEILDKKVSVIFELNNATSTVKYLIGGYNMKRNVVVNQNGPTNILLKFDKFDKYKVSWFVNDKLSFEHNVIVSNYVEKLIFVSCDFLEADTKHSLWDRMVSEVSLNNRTAIVHLGDQAYMDAQFNECEEILFAWSDANTTEKLCFNAFGQRYCETWKPHAKLLSNVSNYYIWDDHEIKNDIRLDNVTDETINFISKIAVNAYNKYQQSFHVNDTYIINKYCWYKYIDEKCSTVILAIERTSREITLQEIFGAIQKLEKINPINRLILCFSSAPIPPPQGGYGNVYKRLIGLGKFWNQNELKNLYEWLFNWMGSKKEVAITGGDIHFGVHGYATRNNQKIPILIASPITNHPSLDRKIAAKGLRGAHIINADKKDNIIIFSTLSSKAKRCYGTIDLESAPMKTNIHYSEDKYPKDIMKYIRALSHF